MTWFKTDWETKLVALLLAGLLWLVVRYAPPPATSPTLLAPGVPAASGAASP